MKLDRDAHRGRRLRPHRRRGHLGDRRLAGAPWLAHKASHEGVMVAELIAGPATRIRTRSTATRSPGCTYCQPAGRQRRADRGQGQGGRATRSRSAHFPFIGNGKAIALGEPEGFIKTVFDAKTGELLGAHMVGAEVTELIQGYVVGKDAGDHRGRTDEHRLPAPDAERDDARGRARRLRAHAAHVAARFEADVNRF